MTLSRMWSTIAALKAQSDSATQAKNPTYKPLTQAQAWERYNEMMDGEIEIRAVSEPLGIHVHDMVISCLSDVHGNTGRFTDTAEAAQMFGTQATLYAHLWADVRDAYYRNPGSGFKLGHYLVLAVDTAYELEHVLRHMNTNQRLSIVETQSFHGIKRSSRIAIPKQRYK